MKYSFGLVLLSFLIIAKNAEAGCSNSSTREVKTYKINLDLPARERFKEVVGDYKDEMIALINFEKKSLNLPPELVKVGEYIAGDLDNFFPYPFNEEIRGITEAIDGTLGDVVIANLIYDITAFCTSIVTTQADGKIIHGRNLDYNFPEYLRNLTVRAEFYRNNTLLFTSAQVAGFLGILSGHRYKQFTFSINERDQGEWWVNFIFALLDKKASPLSFLTRQVLENATDFNDAVNQLSSHDLIAPAYFIVAGVKPNEGVVITRNQSALINTWRLDNSNNIWYLLETNYDHWVPPPPNDDRRTPGMRAMNQTTQANINYNTLFNVLTIDPVCNGETVYTVLMSAAEEGDKAMEIFIR